MRIVRRSAKENMDSAFGSIWPDDAIQSWSRCSDAVVQEHITTRIENMFHVLGNRAQHGVEDVGQLTIGKKFSPRFQQEIANRIFVGIYDGPDFLNFLYRDLSQSLKNRGKLSGDWGRVALDAKGELILAINPPPVKSGSTWKKATVMQY